MLLPLPASEAKMHSDTTQKNAAAPKEKREKTAPSSADATQARFLSALSRDAQSRDTVQMKRGAGGGPSSTSGDVKSQLGSGQALPKDVQSEMGKSFGHDFSQTRVHTDAKSAKMASGMGAKAFATGNSVAFAPGQYNPKSASGKELLAHELTHVVQQSGGVQAKSEGPASGESALEAAGRHWSCQAYRFIGGPYNRSATFWVCQLSGRLIRYSFAADSGERWAADLVHFESHGS